MATLDSPCVRRIYHGGEEVLTYDAWMRICIQDEQAALDVAEQMLEIPLDPYDWNEDEPEFYETFQITDEEVFRAEFIRAQEGY
jgi:hypothetical protein